MFQMKPQDSVIVYTLGKVKISLRKYYRKYNTETVEKKNLLFLSYFILEITCSIIQTGNVLTNIC